MSNFPAEGSKRRRGRTLPTCHQSHRTPERPQKRERTAIDRCYPEPNGTKRRTKRERKKTHQLERFGKTDSAVNCSCSLPEYKKQLAGGADASQIIHPKPIAFSFPIVIEGMQCVTGDNKRYRLRVKRQLTPELNIHQDDSHGKKKKKKKHGRLKAEGHSVV